MKPTLESLRPCLDGAIPAVIATSAADGTPNVAYASQVHYVDADHVALSYQFFSKTRENILAHPYAQAQVIEPGSFRHFRLRLHYQRTETAGALFEYMKAQLAGIAAQTGMDKVFVLRGTDVYRVLDIEAVDAQLPPAPPPPDALLRLRRALGALGDATDLAVPLAHGGRLRGVLYAESEHDAFFSHADEDALVVYARHLAALIAQAACEPEEAEPAHAEPAARPSGAPLAVRYFAADHSVFIGNDYLIKGVAGSILWTLLNEHATSGRRDFCNRELRRDPRLPLPDVGDNLETRLILLQRRLAERCPAIGLQKTGRGRFRLLLTQTLALDAR